MAPPKETYTHKDYSEEAKTRLQEMLAETAETRELLDKLDSQLATTAAPTNDTLKEWARQAVGKGNYLRKKYAKLDAAATNEKDARYMEIKIECEEKGISFVDSSTKIEAEGYIAPLRTIRNIFEAYVISADNIVSVCRMHLASQLKEQAASAAADV